MVEMRLVMMVLLMVRLMVLRFRVMCPVLVGLLKVRLNLSTRNTPSISDSKY